MVTIPSICQLKLFKTRMTGGSDGLRDPRISRTSGGANPHVRYDWMSLQWAFLKKNQERLQKQFSGVMDIPYGSSVL